MNWPVNLPTTCKNHVYIDDEPANVLVFKTNINNGRQRLEVIALLKKMGKVTECWVDIEDCDRVLRIVGNVPQNHIEEAVRSMGFVIEELNY